jgi:hypothetical protein
MTKEYNLLAIPLILFLAVNTVRSWLERVLTLASIAIRNLLNRIGLVCVDNQYLVETAGCDAVLRAAP